MWRTARLFAADRLLSTNAACAAEAGSPLDDATATAILPIVPVFVADRRLSTNAACAEGTGLGQGSAPVTAMYWTARVRAEALRRPQSAAQLRAGLLTTAVAARWTAVGVGKTTPAKTTPASALAVALASHTGLSAARS